MTDLFSEEYLSLAAASRLLPSRPHLSTVWRWCLRGIRGVKLRTVIVGGRRYTTREYLNDFVAHLNAPAGLRPDDSNDRLAERTRAAELAALTF
jgi:hypothetical protein